MSAYQGAPKVAKILVVDDEPDILEIISYNLRKEGYEVKTAENGLEGVAAAKEFLPDMILLDVMMPKMDGMEACKQIRALPSLKNCFILFLTAREEEFVEVLSFQAGADDFLTKPIKPRALISRIEAVLRRSKEDTKVEQTKQIKLGNLVIDRESYQVTQNGKVVVLARKEFELLFFWLQGLARYSPVIKFWKPYGEPMWWSLTVPSMSTFENCVKSSEMPTLPPSRG